jgi:signal transduction histidine kinase
MTQSVGSIDLRVQASQRGFRTATVVVGLTCFSLGLAVLAMVLSAANHQLSTVTIEVAAVAFALVGMVVVRQRPSNRIGWLLVAAGLTIAVFGSAQEYARYTLEVAPGSLPGGHFAAWSLNWLPLLLTGLLVQVLPQLYPTGELVSPRWRLTLWAAAGFILAGTTSNAFIPQQVEGLRDQSNPYAIESAKQIFQAIQLLALVFFVIGIGGGLASMFVRWRRSQGDERQQLKWFIAGLVPLLLALVAHDFTPEAASIAAGLVIPLVPITVGVAILRYRLYELDFFISLALIYAVLSAMVIGVYLGVVAVVGFAISGGDSVLLQAGATLVAAAAFTPLRSRTQRTVDRLLFGDRARPYDALTQMGRRLEQSPAPETVLQGVVDTVADSLRLPFVAIELRDGEAWVQAAQHHSTAGEIETFPMVYQGAAIGRLLVAPRGPGNGFNAADRSLLTDLARQAGIAAHAVRVTSDLQRSRAELVRAREEERRRLRRDLHDGLGPALAGVTLGLHAARATIRRDLEGAERLLDSLEAQVEEAVRDIRRLVYGLRPPALDEVGLVRALQQQAARLEGDASGLTLVIDSPPAGLGHLPAAVEVAAYRIATEAMTNVSRHAHASSCTVLLSLNGALELQVIDDGIGLGSAAVQGVGLAAMRERAAELGGTLDITCTPGRTQVRAVLPISDHHD